MISLVIPFTDGWQYTKRCLEKLVENTTEEVELILIDNGSDEPLVGQARELLDDSKLNMVYVGNVENIGVLQTFKQGFEESRGDIVCFIHSDVLIQQFGWNSMVEKAFNDDPLLGLAGLFGASKVHADGGRENSMSAMAGVEWGKCDCHEVVALHHGNFIARPMPAAVFDGVGLFFRRQVLENLVNTSDMFADWRAPHHFYDRILSLKVLERGYHMAVLPIAFDHWSGATANQSEKYVDFGRQWMFDHGHSTKDGVDNSIYWLAEGQWRKEFEARCPVSVNDNYGVTWNS